jgi:hypothetical protein
MIKTKTIIENNTRRPDIDENISWSLVEDLGDYMIISAPEYEAEQDAKLLRSANQLSVAVNILNGNVPQSRYGEFADIFDLPEVGKTYPTDWILKDEENNLYQVIHTFYWGQYEGFTSNPNVSKL